VTNTLAYWAESYVAKKMECFECGPESFDVIKLWVRFGLVLFSPSLIQVDPSLRFYVLDISSVANVIKHRRNLRIFVISSSVCPWQAFPAESNVYG
jgi:hypothetical protein